MISDAISRFGSNHEFIHCHIGKKMCTAFYIDGQFKNSTYYIIEVALLGIFLLKHYCFENLVS